jgi:hypothetical protein
MSKLLTPETLADVLNKDAPEMEAYNQQIVLAGEMKERHPVELCIALRDHYDEEQLSSFAQPYSREKDNTDWRGLPVKGNQKPIWDHNETTDNLGQTVKYQWYRRFVERLSVGKKYAEIYDILKMTGDTSGKYDLEGKSTIINVEGPMDHQGQSKIVRIDAKLLNPSDRKSYLSMYNARINALANGYRKAMAIHNMWEAITMCPEFEGKVRVDWNWLDPTDMDQGLNKNRAPIKICALKDGSVVSWSVFTIASFIRIDLEQAIKNGATYSSLIESKFKRDDPNRSNAGQGTQASKVSRIKIDQFHVVASEAVALLDNDDTVTALKAMRVRLTPETKAMWDFQTVELANRLERYITQEMLTNHASVCKALADKERKEKEDKAKVLAKKEQEKPKADTVTPFKPKPKGGRKN